MADLKYDVLEKFGVLSTSKSGWEMQLNFVQWGENTPKFDLRTWSPDGSKMGKGLTLTHDEIVKLYEVLGEVLAVENGAPAPVKTEAPAEDYLAEMYYADQMEETAEEAAEEADRPKWGRLSDL
jgi:hypothetical protein